MRRSTHALLGVLLAVANCGYGFAEQSPSWWWPFGKGEEDSQSTSAPAARTTPVARPAPTTVETDSDEAWWPSMPKFQWPDFESPSGPHSAPRANRARSSSYGRPAEMRKRNAWAEPQASRTEQSPAGSPWESVTNGTQKLGESTRNAWHRTVDVLVPGDPADAAAAAPREPRVSWWSRLWGAEEPRSDGPRTVTEWMAQERLDP